MSGTASASLACLRVANVQSLVEIIPPIPVPEKQPRDPMMRPSRPGMLGRDIAMVALALLSIGIVIYDEMRRPGGTFRTALIVIDFAIVVVFLMEFIARLRA